MNETDQKLTAIVERLKQLDPVLFAECYVEYQACISVRVGDAFYWFGTADETWGFDHFLEDGTLLSDGGGNAHLTLESPVDDIADWIAQSVLEKEKRLPCCPRCERQTGVLAVFVREQFRRERFSAAGQYLEEWYEDAEKERFSHFECDKCHAKRETLRFDYDGPRIVIR